MNVEQLRAEAALARRIAESPHPVGEPFRESHRRKARELDREADGQELEAAAGLEGGITGGDELLREIDRVGAEGWPWRPGSRRTDGIAKLRRLRDDPDVQEAVRSLHEAAVRPLLSESGLAAGESPARALALDVEYGPCWRCSGMGV